MVTVFLDVLFEAAPTAELGDYKALFGLLIDIESLENVIAADVHECFLFAVEEVLGDFVVDLGHIDEFDGDFLLGLLMVAWMYEWVTKVDSSCGALAEQIVLEVVVGADLVD